MAACRQHMLSWDLVLLPCLGGGDLVRDPFPEYEPMVCVDFGPFAHCGTHLAWLTSWSTTNNNLNQN